MIDRVESASYDPEPMTPPIHPETEKLIAEFEKEFGHHGEIWNGKKSSPDELEVRDFIRTALNTSFASGQAQGAREEKELMQGKLHSLWGKLSSGKEITLTDIRELIDALKGEL